MKNKELKKTINKTLQKSNDPTSEAIVAIVNSKSLTEAAERLSVSRVTLYEWLDKYPQIKETVEKMKEQALLNLKQGSMRASEVVIEHLEHKDKGLEAAQDLLDRVGISSKAPGVAVQMNNIGGDMGLVVKEYKADD